MHLIYSKLKSANIMSGKIKDRMFSVEFKPDKKNQVNDDQFEALMNEEGSTLKYLLNSGDFVEDAESASAEISSLKGDIRKLVKALKNAEDKAKLEEKQESGIGKAEDALMKAEDAMEKATSPEEKKVAGTGIKNAKKALIEAKKEAKKAVK